MDPPATLCKLNYDPHLCARDTAAAARIVAELRAEHPELQSWITFPLLNSTGSPKDFALAEKVTTPLATPYAKRLPYTMAVIGSIEELGVAVRQARVAVLLGRDVLRPHVDEFRSTRLLLALNEQGKDFRYIFDLSCFAMRAGQLWQVRVDVCPSAAHASPHGMRA